MFSQECQNVEMVAEEEEEEPAGWLADWLNQAEVTNLAWPGLGGMMMTDCQHPTPHFATRYLQPFSVKGVRSERTAPIIQRCSENDMYGWHTPAAND